VTVDRERIRRIRARVGKGQNEDAEPLRWLHRAELVDAITVRASEPWVPIAIGPHTLCEVRPGGIVTLVGPTGRGKSSLVRAGVIPALLADDPELRLVALTPGDDPDGRLDADLRTDARPDRPGARGPGGVPLIPGRGWCWSTSSRNASRSAPTRSPGDGSSTGWRRSRTPPACCSLRCVVTSTGRRPNIRAWPLSSRSATCWSARCGRRSCTRRSRRPLAGRASASTQASPM
jgi:hypothetical protein